MGNPSRFLFTAVLVFLCQSSYAHVIRVPLDEPTIQAGINAASISDTVIVADGVYIGDGNSDIDLLGKDVLVTSENGPEYTVVDCRGNPSEGHRGFIFTSGEGPGTVLRGFTVMNGYAVVTAPGPPSGCGAGILCSNMSSPTVQDCEIRDCTAEMFGGGMFIYRESSPLVINCTFIGNQVLHGFLVAGFGGGLSIYGESDPEIAGCSFVMNSAADLGGGIAVNFLSSPCIHDCFVCGNSSSGDGGGICSGGSAVGENCSPEIVDCEISENSAVVYGGGIGCFFGSSYVNRNLLARNTAGWGGGISLYRGHPAIEDNLIENNEAQVGGGICVVDRADVTVIGCTVTGNHATGDGGGVFSYASLTAYNCTVVKNSAGRSGGGIFTDKDNEFHSCTIAENDAGLYGGGVLAQLFADPFFVNCILWSNTPDEVHDLLGADPVIVFSDIRDGWTGEGNIDVNPLFTDSGTGDYRLLPDSPCIDSGDPTVPAPPHGGDRIDMGADEYEYPEDPPIRLVFSNTPETGEPGEVVTWDFTVENLTGQLVVFDGWVAVSGPKNSVRDSLLGIVLPPYTAHNGKASIEIAHCAPLGRYTAKGRVGLFHAEIWDGEVFDGEVVGGIRASLPGSGGCGWQVDLEIRE